MQGNELAVLKADILAQQQAIERVFALLEERAIGLVPDNPEKFYSYSELVVVVNSTSRRKAIFFRR